MEIDGLEMQEIDNIFNDAYKKTTTLREAWRYAMMRYAEIYHDREVKKLNEPAVSKCDGIENEAQLIAFISWYEKLSVEEIVWYDGKLLEAFKKAINCC